MKSNVVSAKLLEEMLVDLEEGDGKEILQSLYKDTRYQYFVEEYERIKANSNRLMLTGNEEDKSTSQSIPRKDSVDLEAQ